MKRPILLLAAALTACGNERPPDGVCTPGDARCTGSAYEVCADDGMRWVAQMDCGATSQVCIANLGCRACYPGQLRCGGDDGFDVLRCRDDGSALDLVTSCDPEVGDLCAAGQCRNACEYAAEAFGYEGCEYWAVDLDNAVVSDQGTAAAQQYSIVVSNPLELPAIVTVEVNDAAPGEPVALRTVAQTQLARIVGGGDLAVIDLPARELDGSTDPRLNDGPGTFLSSNAFRITSTAPIVAYQFNPLENVGVFSNDASLLLPSTALGKTYWVMGWPQTLAITEDAATNGGIHLRAFLTIVGTEPETTVQVTLATRILGGGPIPPTDAAGVVNLTIGPFDVINLETDGFNADFTSSYVWADKKVAVFSGGEASDVPFFESFAERDCCADHLEEQLFPETAYGAQFVAVKTPLRTEFVEAGGWDVAVVPDERDYWRVLAVAEETTVRTTLPEPFDAFHLVRGQVVTFWSERDFLVEANNPIVFGQFPASQQATGIPPVVDGQRPPGGDPSFILVPPVEQWRDKYVFLVPNKYAFDFLLLAIPVGTTVLYDDLPLSSVLDCEYDPIGEMVVGTDTIEYQAVRCPLSSPTIEDPTNPAYQDDGRHEVQSLDGSPFGLVVWGWDSYVSYGYPGGTNMKIINEE